jgi:hypothetical protein
MKKAIRLTENDLHRIVRRSVNRIMNEEWESPLDKVKKNRNDFDNVKKIDVSKFQKKPKKSKKGTLEDLPSFEKLKGLKFENRINRIVKESVNEISRGKALDVSSDMGKLYEDIANDFGEFYNTLHFSLQGNENNRYLQEIMKHAKAIGDILSRKFKQSSDIEGAVFKKSFKDWAAENPNYTDDDEYWQAQI